MAILLLFDDADALSLKDISTRTGLQPKNLQGFLGRFVRARLL